MKLVNKIERGGLIGSLYLEKYGYTFKITGRIKSIYAPKGRNEVVARSYCYLKDKKQAEEQMENRMAELIEITPLFNINEYRKDK